MADSIIQQVTNNSSSNYCKMPDGTLIQWGRKYIKSGTTAQYGSIYILAVSIEFPVPFIDTNFSVTGSSRFGTGAELAFGSVGGTTTYASVRLWDVVSRTASTSAYWTIFWMAVGRWK